jgi:ATP adenylyltransferase
MSSCCLCSKLGLQTPDEIWDQPLLETENFVVIPSLGSLVPGWVLVVPRRHFLCMGALPQDLVAEMDSIKVRAVSTVSAEYGSVCVFEHGPSGANHQVGCGVDHAHTHIVPVDFDLAGAAEAFMPGDVRWHENAAWGDCRKAFLDQSDYLYLEQANRPSLIATHDNFGNQVFRRAIAAQMGIPQQFNWREHPRIDVIGDTVRRWSDARA